jgi:hypothetical protein
MDSGENMVNLAVNNLSGTGILSIVRSAANRNSDSRNVLGIGDRAAGLGGKGVIDLQKDSLSINGGLANLQEGLLTSSKPGGGTGGIIDIVA